MFKLKATLTHLAIISWAVPAKKLEALLDPRVTAKLTLQTIDDSGDLTLVSLACLLDRTLWQTYAQLNERVYMTQQNGTRPGAFFWISRADTWQADFFRIVLGIPEYREQLRLSVNRDRYTLIRQGREIVELDLSTAPARSPADSERLAAIGLNPMMGYTLDRAGLDSTKVVHTTIERREVRVVTADASFMRASSLIGSEKPLVAWYVPSTPFDIELPPQLVR
jgi:hypothetical protein